MGSEEIMAASIDWVEVPAGEFVMGLSEEHAQEIRRVYAPLTDDRLQHWFAFEMPQRTVDVKCFYISRFPVTWAQLDAFVRGDDYRFTPVPPEDISDRATQPAHCSWHLAGHFCHWVGARLPSSFEWEKAARGTDGRLYPWGNEWDANRCNFDRATNRGLPDRYGKKSVFTPVDAYPEGVSPYGIYDMAGNCAEWTMTHILDQQGYDRINRPDHYSQQIVVRSWPVDREGGIPPIAYRVTNIIRASLVPGGHPPQTTFRPVMDEWQRQYFLGASSGETQAKDVRS